MIVYFSGTGNSAYAASRIGEALHDEVLDLFERLRGQNFSPLHSDQPWVVVTPTYAWRIPRLVQEWLEKTPLTGSRDIWFVMTCGENIGSAEVYAEKLCAEKGLNCMGCLPVVMPENYIALFKTPDEKAAKPILRRPKRPLMRPRSSSITASDIGRPRIRCSISCAAALSTVDSTRFSYTRKNLLLPMRA